MCPDCKETKDKPLTYTRCQRCGNWRFMTDDEKKKVARRAK